jgi:hypothetical protein
LLWPKEQTPLSPSGCHGSSPNAGLRPEFFQEKAQIPALLDYVTWHQFFIHRAFAIETTTERCLICLRVFRVTQGTLNSPFPSHFIQYLRSCQTLSVRVGPFLAARRGRRFTQGMIRSILKHGDGNLSGWYNGDTNIPDKEAESFSRHDGSAKSHATQTLRMCNEQKNY